MVKCYGRKIVDLINGAALTVYPSYRWLSDRTARNEKCTLNAFIGTTIPPFLS